MPTILGAQYLSLEEAVEIGLRENLGLMTADALALSAKANTGAGAAGMLPSITAAGGGTFSLDNATQTFLDGRENVITGGVDKRLNASIQADWTLYDGKAMFLRKDQLQDEFELAVLARNREALQLTADISRAYQELVLQARLISILEEDLNYLTDLLELTEAKLTIGSATRLDVLQAKTDLNELINSRNLALLQYDIVAGSLNRDLNRESTMPVTVDTSFLMPEGMLAYEQWTELALASNPDLQYSAKEVAIAEREIALAEAERKPTLDLSSGYNFSYLSSNSGFLTSNRSFSPFIGLSASLNIFDGNRVNRNIEVAKFSATVARLGYDQASLSTKNEMYLNYQQYEYYVEQARVEQENLMLAEENFALADELYRSGVINQFELRQVRIQRLAIERRLAQAEYEQTQAYIGLMELSGQPWL
ncbi:TolC family protein [Neolewinella aurantiaca]|uniref:TolC family protein n=1 Tax=Neolewinella aurantiaca TaxID=2602767 RepID=UPI001C9C5A7D|nr:TolC family protein [Neolewinella aurantiaca]